MLQQITNVNMKYLNSLLSRKWSVMKSEGSKFLNEKLFLHWLPNIFEFVLVYGYHYNAQKYQDIFKENINCYGKKLNKCGILSLWKKKTEFWTNEFTLRFYTRRMRWWMQKECYCVIVPFKMYRCECFCIFSLRI